MKWNEIFIPVELNSSHSPNSWLYLFLFSLSILYCWMIFINLYSLAPRPTILLPPSIEFWNTVRAGNDTISAYVARTKIRSKNQNKENKYPEKI